MIQTCPRCSRVNPPEAKYCFFDGGFLGVQGGDVGPVNTSVELFHHPFTFPSGRICRNFDELALACQEEWAEATQLLRDGLVERFLAGLGRADLALAAREAARFPDQDRGLDQLLARLPSDVLAPARLQVEPTMVNLGALRVGEDRTFEVHLSNKGMRLVYGAVTVPDGIWLALGESPGGPEKSFQFGVEQTIAVHVRGHCLRASARTLASDLLIDSNAGTATVKVRADVPVVPYPDGIFSEARTPREIADRAKENLRNKRVETIRPFEDGGIARWYARNGWVYPVQGPAAKGMAAVQQFFDALGLSRPPQVDLVRSEMTLAGNVGAELRDSLELRARERRPIYAQAESDQAWLEIGRPRLDSRSATLTFPVQVPQVPDHEGQTLHAHVTIVANGFQRFTVPVTLEVGGSFFFRSDVDAVVDTPVDVVPPSRTTSDTPISSTANRAIGKIALHAIPAMLLALALCGVVIGDLVHPRGPSVEAIIEDPEPRVAVNFDHRMRFGLVMAKEPDPANPRQLKRLTAKDNGASNNTCIRINGIDYLFGTPPGAWGNDGQGRSLKKVTLPNLNGCTSVWEYPNRNIRVRQTVEIIRNEQSRLLDTCFVHYLVENQGTEASSVGLRVMLDTFIGTNDGVPFVVPGQSHLLETKQIFPPKEIPDYIEALERPDPADPGTIAHLGLRLENERAQPDDPDPEPLEKLVVCRWPGAEKRWDWEYKAMNDPPDEKKDSCVVLYWEEASMQPGARRAMAFTYGVGQIANAHSGNLGISLGGSFRPGNVFTVTVYVKNPKAGQKIKLGLPSGLRLAPNPPQSEEQVMNQGSDFAQVSWRVQSEKEGVATIEVSSGLERQTMEVTIRHSRLFN